MAGTVRKLFILLFILLVVFGCIDPYTPNLSSYKPMLVIEGHVSDANRSYTVRLSYSMQRTDSLSTVSDATVSVVDNNGTEYPFASGGGGIYRSDSLTFKGEVGRTYKLKIRTAQGNEYESDSCTMLPVPGIDSLYFQKDEHLVHNQTAIKKGISIFLDSKPGPVDDNYLRWEYDENWKFKLTYPKLYRYTLGTGIIRLPADSIHEYCWKSGKSSDILTEAVYSQERERVIKFPLRFIASDESDRLSLRYCLTVRQYGISQAEYQYLTDLIKESQSEGDIFGPQPFEVLGNIKNVNDPSEKVPGYFEVAAVSERRIYVDATQLYSMLLPQLPETCFAYPYSIYDMPFNPYVVYTWMDVYYHFGHEIGLTFIKPVYADLNEETLKYLVFTTRECADCSITGSAMAPSFWQDN
jgi:hypothetical protein